MSALFASATYQFNPYALPPLVVAAAMVHIGLVTLRREGLTAVSLTFVGVILALSGWLAGVGAAYLTTDDQAAAFWFRLTYGCLCLLPVAALAFALAFSDRYRHYRLWLTTSGVVSLFLLVNILLPENPFFTGIQRYWWGPGVLLGRPGYLLILHIGMAVVLVITILILEARCWPTTSLQRQRAVNLAKAFAVSSLAMVDFLPKFGVHVYPAGYLAILAFIIIANRTIRLYKLRDITPAYAADSIIATMRDGLLVLDEAGVVRVANPAAAALFGRRMEEIVGKRASRFLALPELPAGTAVSRRLEITITGRDNRPRHLQLSLTRTQPEPRQPLATVCLLHDITERKEAEMALQQAHALLEQRVEERTRELAEAHRQLRRSEKLRAIGMLTSSVAHEVGGPIFAIRNLLEGLRQEDGLADDQRQLIDSGIAECSRVGKLLRNLRDLHTSTSAPPQAVDLARLVDDVLLLCREQCDREGITLIRHYPQRPVRALAAPDQLKQVVLNLVHNARDAMGDGGTLTITVNGDGSHARLAVADTGCGMDAEQLARIFEPFFTTKETQFGTGLGLYISYEIVKRQGGDIDVVSAPGQGATFTVTLPTATS